MPEIEPAPVFWITGLSGAGKTTVATFLTERLRARGQPVIQLDGDRMRALLPHGSGYEPAQRLELALSYGRWCKEIAEQGVTVVCATISMFHAVRDWNRHNIPHYYEVYLRVSAEERARRDAKGLYRAAQRGDIAQMVGLDLEPELPCTPDLVLDNEDGMSPEIAVDEILAIFTPRRTRHVMAAALC